VKQQSEKIKASRMESDQVRSILFLLPGYAPAPIGGYKVVYSYANYLSKNGFTVTILHAWDFPKDPLTATIVDRARRLRRLPEILSARRPRWFNLEPAIKVVNKFRADQTDLRNQDIVIATAAQTASLAAEAPRGVYLIQHYEEWSRPKDFVDQTLQLPLLRITVAPWLNDIVTDLGVEAAFLPNAIDSSQFPTGLSINERPIRVSAMLSDHPWKRTDLVLDIIKLLTASGQKIDVVLFGIGSRPKHLPAEVKYSQKPTLKELSEIYRSSRVFLCASDKEGWGLPAAEAMMSGAALVSTRNGGVESFAEGVSLLSEAGDAETLANNIILLLEDASLCQEIASSGCNRIRSYTPNHAGAAFSELILS
jgi:glycosyltransferase involved in cell wall biosynthesis